jgi:hypothetical protein
MNNVFEDADERYISYKKMNIMTLGCGNKEGRKQKRRSKEGKRKGKREL